MAVPPSMPVLELNLVMREKLKSEEKAGVGEKGAVGARGSSSIETKRLRFMYKGRELKDSLASVQGGDAISLFVLPMKKVPRGFCSFFFGCGGVRKR